MASDSAFSDDVAFTARGQLGPGIHYLVSGLGRQSFQSQFFFSGSEKNYFPEFLVFCTALGKGGVVATRTRQGEARQGRQFVIMVGIGQAFWPGGNVIPGIIALAFVLSRWIFTPCVCVCMRMCR